MAMISLKVRELGGSRDAGAEPNARQRCSM